MCTVSAKEPPPGYLLIFLPAIVLKTDLLGRLNDAVASLRGHLAKPAVHMARCAGFQGPAHLLNGAAAHGCPRIDIPTHRMLHKALDIPSRFFLFYRTAGNFPAAGF